MFTRLLVISLPRVSSQALWADGEAGKIKNTTYLKPQSLPLLAVSTFV